MREISDNINQIQKEINAICEKQGRASSEVTLIAVTKTVDTDRIKYAIESGITDIGENKVQEVIAKYDQIEKNVKWHLIGHLQSNKVKYIIDKVDLIHSLDSIELAREIDKRAAKAGLMKDVLIQVNVAKEESKFGIDFEEIDSFLEQLRELKHLKVLGFMTITPNFEDVENTRPIFRQLKQKFDQCKALGLPNVEMKYLSMGMTGDYKVAVEEGANLIRIGTGIFGKRNYNL